MRSIRSVLVFGSIVLSASGAIAMNGVAEQTLEICSSHQSSSIEIVSKLSAAGWSEVEQSAGEAVIDRTIWVHFPRVADERIKVKAKYGAVCGHQHCGRPQLGDLDWSDTAKTHAFVQERSALFVLIRPKHHYKNYEDSVFQDYQRCTAVFGDDTLAEEFASTIENRMFSEVHSGSLVHLTKKNQSRMNFDSSIPRQKLHSIAYVPDQTIVQKHNLDHLDYQVGFTTEFSLTYFEEKQ